MPFISPVHASLGSPRARELADRIVDQIEQYCREHPSTTDVDIRLALHLAHRRTWRLGQHLGIAVALIVSVLGMVVFLVAGQQNGVIPAGHQMIPIALVVMGIVVLAAAVLVARSGGGEEGVSHPLVLILGGVVLIAALVAIYLLAMHTP